MPKRPLKLLTRFQMTELNTQRLLAYRDRLLSAPESPPEGPPEGSYDSDSTVHKALPEWKTAYNECLALLNTREHVRRGRALKDNRSPR